MVAAVLAAVAARRRAATTVAVVLGVLRFEAADDDGELFAAAREALTLLAARPGFRSGKVCRAYDQPRLALSAAPSGEHRGERASEERTEGAVTLWCLITEWESVGAYRRALGSYEVRARATPLLSRALPEPSVYEPLAVAEGGGPDAVRSRESDQSIASRHERAEHGQQRQDRP